MDKDMGYQASFSPIHTRSAFQNFIFYRHPIFPLHSIPFHADGIASHQHYEKGSLPAYFERSTDALRSKYESISFGVQAYSERSTITVKLCHDNKIP